VHESEIARTVLVSAATARPARGALAALLVIASAAAVAAAESLLGVPTGTVYLAGDEAPE
jgi:hypothetical protein